MVNSVYVMLPVAAVLGFLSGVGVGGGSLLILWLTVVAGYPTEQARFLNLLFFIPCAAAATLMRWKQGHLQWKLVLSAAIPGCICAGAVSWLFGSLDSDLLKKAFGILLLFTGIREVFYRERKAK